MLINLCPETMKPILRGTRYDGCGRNASIVSINIMYSVSRILFSGEGRAVSSMGGAKKGAGAGGSNSCRSHKCIGTSLP